MVWTGSPVASHVDDAVAAARAALPAWSAWPMANRIAALRVFPRLCAERVEKLGGLIADETGNSVRELEPKGTDESVVNIVNDTEAPTVVITAPASVTGPFEAVFEFSEPVSDFTASDLSLSNATASEPVAVAAKTSENTAMAGLAQTYRATITPLEHGAVTIGLSGAAVRDAAGNANLASQTVTVTYTDVNLVQTRTGAAINNFIYRRAGNILATQPDLSGRLDDRGGLGMTEKFAFAADGDENSLNIEFAGSLSRLMSDEPMAYADGATPGTATESGDAERPRFNVWASGSLSRSSVGGQTQDFGVVHLGADYRINQAFLVGAMGQFDHASESDPATGISASGDGWMIGPYTVIRLHDTLTFDGRVLWGRSSNDIAPFGTYSDRFETERVLVKAQLTGQFDLSGWTVSPQLSLAYLSETQEAYVNAANIAIAERTVEIGQLSFGPTISRVVQLDNGVRVSPRASLKGLWNFKDTGIANLDTGILSGGQGSDLRARADVGVTTEFGLGATLDVSGFVEGIGNGDDMIYGGAAKLNIPF